MFLSEYIKNLADSKSENTIKAYARNIIEFVKWLSFKYSIVDNKRVELTHLKDYQNYLIYEKGFKVSGILLRMNSVISYYRFLYKNNYITEDITLGFEFIKEKERGTVIQSINKKDISKFKQEVYKGSNLRDIAIIEILANTGIKPSELIRLAPDDVELSNNKGYIRIKKNKNKSCLIPLNSFTCKAIHNYLNCYGDKIFKSNKLWVGQRGTLTQDGLSKMIKRYANKCGLGEKIHPKMFREYLISCLINDRKIESILVSEFLGGITEHTRRRLMTSNLEILEESLEFIYVGA